MKPFAEVQGSWRPDFLITEELRYTKAPDSFIDRVKICEINARFAFNGFISCAFSNEHYERKGLELHGLKSDAEAKKVR